MQRTFRAITVSSVVYVSSQKGHGSWIYLWPTQFENHITQLCTEVTITITYLENYRRRRITRQQQRRDKSWVYDRSITTDDTTAKYQKGPLWTRYNHIKYKPKLPDHVYPIRSVKDTVSKDPVQGHSWGRILIQSRSHSRKHRHQ